MDQLNRVSNQVKYANNRLRQMKKVLELNDLKVVETIESSQEQDAMVSFKYDGTQYDAQICLDGHIIVYEDYMDLWDHESLPETVNFIITKICGRDTKVVKVGKSLDEWELGDMIFSALDSPIPDDNGIAINHGFARVRPTEFGEDALLVHKQNYDGTTDEMYLTYEELEAMYQLMGRAK